MTGVVSVVGVGPVNADAERRPPHHHAASRAASARRGGRDHRAPAAGDRRHSRHDGLFPAGAGHPDSTRPSRAQYQYTLVGTDAAEVAAWSETAGRRAARATRPLRDVVVRGAGGRPARADQGRPREGRPARHLDAGDQRHAQRRVRPAADLDHLRPGQPVSRDPGGRAAVPARSVRAVEDLHAGEHPEPAARNIERAEHPAAVELRARARQHAGAARAPSPR